MRSWGEGEFLGIGGVGGGGVEEDAPSFGKGLKRGRGGGGRNPFQRANSQIHSLMGQSGNQGRVTFSGPVSEMPIACSKAG